MLWRTNKTNIYPPDFHPGENFRIGDHCTIEPGVKIGNNVVIGHYALIKTGTVIEDNVFFDSFCISSGQCVIGEGSQIRYQSIVARNVKIGKNVFFCAGVKTAYLTHDRDQSVKTMEIGDNVFVGDNSTILAGVKIYDGIVIGAHTLVTKDLDLPYAIYIGCPANYVRPLTREERSRVIQSEIDRVKKKGKK